MPGVDEPHIRTFESLQLEGSHVGDLLYKNSHHRATLRREGYT